MLTKEVKDKLVNVIQQKVNMLLKEHQADGYSMPNSWYQIEYPLGDKFGVSVLKGDGTVLDVEIFTSFNELKTRWSRPIEDKTIFELADPLLDIIDEEVTKIRIE